MTKLSEAGEHETADMTTLKSLPPNIQEFNEITAVIFSQLYISHPMPKTIDPTEVASTLGISASETMPSGRTFNDVFGHTVNWLLTQKFIFSHGSFPRERVILTDKALVAMNVVPPSLNQSRGSELVDASKQAASETGKNRIAELVGTVLGSIAKTMMEG